MYFWSLIGWITVLSQYKVVYKAYVHYTRVQRARPPYEEVEAVT